MKRIAWTVFGWLVLMTTAQAASFDCAKANTKIEKLICNNTEISKLDDILSKIYQQVLDHSTDKLNSTKEQRQWLKSVRNACPDLDCLWGAYQTRVDDLADKLNQAKAQVKFEGIYKNLEHSVPADYRDYDRFPGEWEGTFDYLRFYEDGSVIFVGFQATPEELKEWFKKENTNHEGATIYKGKYITKGNHISFILHGSYADSSGLPIDGSTDCKGVIDGSAIYIHCFYQVSNLHHVATYIVCRMGR